MLRAPLLVSCCLLCALYHARADGLPAAPPVSKLLASAGLPALNATLPPKPALPFGSASMAGLLPDLLGPDGLPSAMTEGGLTYTADRLGSSSSAPYYHYPAPSDNISNPQPYPAPERIDQVLSYMQKEQVTGISRWIFPFTTKLLPNTELQTSAANPDLPLNMNGRRLHSAAASVALEQGAGQQRRSLQQAYTYDALRRLQYSPANGVITSSDFQQAFQTAITNSNAAGMVLTPGSYQVSVDDPNAPVHLNMQCNGRQQAFELDITGSTLTFTAIDYGGFLVHNCASLTMHGPATLTYDTAALGFSQGTVTSIGPEDDDGRSNITLQIDAGYPVETLLLSSATLLAIAFDPVSGVLAPNTSDIYLPAPTSYTTDSSGVTTLLYLAYPQFNLQTSARLAQTSPSPHLTLALSAGNSYSTFSFLTIETANQFAIADLFGAANRFLNNIIAPRATPFPGTGTVPLLSSVADGIHAAEDTQGPTLVNNTILSNGDDAIALEGAFFIVAATNPARRQVIVTATSYKAVIGRGDVLTGFTNVSQSLGSAIVVAVSTTTVPPAAAAQGMSSTAQYDFNDPSSVYLAVTFATYPQAFNSLQLDSLMTDPNRLCSGYTIRNNTISNNRGRGMIIKASTGTISQNTVLLPKLPGIMMVPDLYFVEASFVSNTVITGNTITAERGGIQIGYFLSGYPTYPGAYANHNTITISNNVLSGSSFVPLLVTSASNVQLTNNAFNGNWCYPFCYTDQYMPFIIQGSLIELSNVRNVQGSGNTIDPAGCQYTAASPFTGSGTESNVVCC